LSSDYATQGKEKYENFEVSPEELLNFYGPEPPDDKEKIEKDLKNVFVHIKK
jgi:hypothetical protein